MTCSQRVLKVKGSSEAWAWACAAIFVVSVAPMVASGGGGLADAETNTLRATRAPDERSGLVLQDMLLQGYAQAAVDPAR